MSRKTKQAVFVMRPNTSAPVWGFWVRYRTLDKDTRIEADLTYPQAWQAMREYQDKVDACGGRMPSRMGIRHDLSPSWDDWRIEGWSPKVQ
jgi:hypothetical protein